jgi:predicted SAM-dependent methyltransferase
VDVRELLKQSETLVGAVRDCRRLVSSLRRVGRSDPVTISRRYFASARVKKLQLGTGPTVMPGWLGSDIAPLSDETMYLDATKPFSFPDATFDYIYSEHMIEHVSWRDGLKMLSECRRVLKPGGVLRVATPDLAVMAGLLTDHREIARRYITWVQEFAFKDTPVRSTAFAINCAFSNWGHKFIYDAETLELTMRLAGFNGTRRCAPGQSGDPHLAGIETHGVNVCAPEMGDFETMVIEATGAEPRSLPAPAYAPSNASVM